VKQDGLESARGGTTDLGFTVDTSEDQIAERIRHQGRHTRKEQKAPWYEPSHNPKLLGQRSMTAVQAEEKRALGA